MINNSPAKIRNKKKVKEKKNYVNQPTHLYLQKPTFPCIIFGAREMLTFCPEEQQEWT